MEKNVVLEMRNICMIFPGVRALDKVDFTLRKGEIRALMGENGAGKSTLIKCLTGVNKFEEGEIYLDGIEGPIAIVWILFSKLCWQRFPMLQNPCFYAILYFRKLWPLLNH